MKINAEELIDLMFLPMSDERIIEMIDSLGMEQPMMDERFEVDGCVFVPDRNNVGIDFCFGEKEEFSQNGEPVLDKIDLINTGKVKLPFDLEFSDNYKICCEKLGKIADYYSPYGLESRKWVLKTKNKENYSLNIHFTDKSLNQIRSVVIGIFSTEQIGKVLFENKE